MHKAILLLRLEGPMQSWGTRSRWDVRETAPEPTKSGVIGIIGCALGLKRGDPCLEKLDQSLEFSVRVDRPGVLAQDYQTVTGFHLTAAGQYKHAGESGGKIATASSLESALKNEEFTIVTPRDYLHDASFLVALASGNEELLEQIAGTAGSSPWPGNIQSPFWPIFLGRKSCPPARPLYERLAKEYRTAEEALSREPWSPPRSPKTALKPPATLVAWVESPSGAHERQDALRLNQSRFYGFRRCKKVEINSQNLIGQEGRTP